MNKSIKYMLLMALLFVAGAAHADELYDAVATTTDAVDLLTGTVGNESRYWANCMYPRPSAARPLDFFYSVYLPGTWGMCMNALPDKERAILDSCIQDCANMTSPFHETDDDNPNLNFGFNDIWSQTEILSELQFRLPQIRLAENHLKNAAVQAQGKGCYMYRFEKEQVRPDKPWVRSMHASELPYLFNHPYYIEYGPLNNGLLDRFSEMIVEFVRTGVPRFRAQDGGELKTAPNYNTTTRPTVVIRNVKPGEDVVTDSCAIEIVNDPKRARRTKLMPVSEALPPGMF